jgi:hypothetical protein
MISRSSWLRLSIKLINSYEYFSAALSLGPGQVTKDLFLVELHSLAGLGLCCGHCTFRRCQGSSKTSPPILELIVEKIEDIGSPMDLPLIVEAQNICPVVKKVTL